MEIKEGNHVLIVGCGYIGSALGQYLVEKNVLVSGTTRSEEKASYLKKLGIRPIISDLTTAKGFAEFNTPDNIVVCPAPFESSLQAYDEVYRVGIKRLMTYLNFNPPKSSLIYTSSIGVYDEREGKWVNEETETKPASDRIAALLEAESAINQAPFKTVVARLGGIYGPGRNRLNLIKEKKILIEDFKKYVNLIYVTDVVKTLVFLLQWGKNRGIYNVVDRKPVLRTEILEWIARETGTNIEFQTVEPKKDRFRETQNKRCSNQKLIDLGYEFEAPTYQEGYGQLIKETKTT